MRNVKLPSWGTVLAWLGVLGTITGLIAFIFGGNLPDLLGLTTPGLSQEELLSTMIALQSDRADAELQLTQIAVANLAAANESTAQALDQLLSNSQATLTAVASGADSVLATQNAVAAQTATADAANALGTQAALDAGATAAALANVTPTPTPLPTATEVPVAVTDWRQLVDATVDARGGALQFNLRTGQAIPDNPGTGLAYVWLIDTDRDSTTGQPVQDIGADARVAVEFQNGAWIGTVRSLQADGTQGDPFFFLDIQVGGPNLSATIDDPGGVGLTLIFNWVVRAEGPGQVFPILPEFSHFTVG